jgi:hypothetical protein
MNQKDQPQKVPVPALPREWPVDPKDIQRILGRELIDAERNKKTRR